MKELKSGVVEKVKKFSSIEHYSSDSNDDEKRVKKQSKSGFY